MKLRTKLMDVAKAVADAAERDPELADQLAAIFGAGPATKPEPEPSAGARPKNRRPPAVLDPVAVAREGEAALRERLTPLSFDQLRDIIADYGMDPGKLVMKWKDPARVLNRIVEVSLQRASKGDAFRAE
jgi:hypothetical protein